MSILVKGMEMPTSCFYCPFRKKVNPDDYVCMALNKEFAETFSLIVGKRHKDCPLVSVPPHGALIDRDALMKDGWLSLHKEVMRMGGYAIHELPLINPTIPVVIERENK